MQMKTLAAAVSVALGAGFGTTASAADLDTYVSGASALRNSIARLVANYCTTGTAAIYEWSAPPSGTSGADFRAYSCTFKPSTDPVVGTQLSDAGLAGKTALIRHTVSVSTAIGGSITGVTPLYRNIPLKFLEPGTVNFTTPAAPSGCTATSADAFTGLPRFTCPTAADNRPDWGVSDTEPAVYRSSVNLPAVAPWNTPPGAPGDEAVSSAPLFAQGFGFIVNSALPISNLSRDQITAILAGTIDNWQQVGGPNLTVKLCRRTAGSGTQATSNALFLYNPGSPSPADGARAPAGLADTGPTGSLVVVENETTGQLRTCVSTVAGGQGAIGFLGLENNAPSGWKYIGVDGVNPYDAAEVASPADGTQDQIREDLLISGAYSVWVESTIQKRDSISGTKLAFHDLVAGNAGKPEITKLLPGVISSCSALATTSPTTPRPANGGALNYTREGNSFKSAGYCAF